MAGITLEIIDGEPVLVAPTVCPDEPDNMREPAPWAVVEHHDWRGCPDPALETCCHTVAVRDHATRTEYRTVKHGICIEHGG